MVSDLAMTGKSGAHPPRISATIGLLISIAALLSFGGCQTTGDGEFAETLYDRLTDADVVLAVETMQIALETGSDGAIGRWANPETGNSGAIQPIRTYQTEGGYFCRDFDELLNVAGNVETYQNHACRADDGIWRFYDD